MVNSASQKDYDDIVAFALSFEEKRHKGKPEFSQWEDSPVKFIHTLPPATKGSLGRKIAEFWAQNNGYEARIEYVDKQHYVLIDGCRFQVKMSTPWDTGTYRFQQIRDTDFDCGFFIGVSAHDIHVWIIPKEVLDTHVIGSLGQHTGQDASDTWWLEVNVNAVPAWLEEYGAQLSDSKRIIDGLLN